MSGRRLNSDSGDPDLWSKGSVFEGPSEPISIDPSPHIPLQQTTDEPLKRWLASHFDAKRLVFVDESDFNTSMRRLRARAPKGKRTYGKIPRNRGKNTILIASITLEGAMGASMTVEGATDSEALEAST